jgi:hypothetical protein
MDLLLTEKSKIIGQIYVITNTLSCQQYVGQTLSHRKNRNKYIPFGFIGRFNDHISEAICNTKKKQCWYLNNAIRKNGIDVWEVKLIKECLVSELDSQERQYIIEYNTLYPNGYNLTCGGKTTVHIKHEFSENTALPQSRGGCKFRTAKTRTLISNQSKEFSNKPEMIKTRSENAKNQHFQNKLEIMKGIIIDPLNLDQYITLRKNSAIIRIDKTIVRFTGKHETIEDLKKRSLEFLKNLATLPNCSGNPLEP